MPRPANMQVHDQSQHADYQELAHLANGLEIHHLAVGSEAWRGAACWLRTSPFSLEPIRPVLIDGPNLTCVSSGGQGASLPRKRHLQAMNYYSSDVNVVFA